MALRRTPQQLSAWAHGGINPLPQTQQAQPAPWQLGGKGPQGGAQTTPVQDPNAGFAQGILGMYPQIPTAPQAPVGGGGGSAPGRSGAGGGQAPTQAAVQNPVGDLTQWMQGMYPEQPTTPQPLEGGYGSGAFNILGPFGGAGMGGAGAGVPAPSQISTGITQPNIPAAPTMPGQGAGPQGLGSQATQDASAANWPQAVQPEFMKLLASYYPQAAGLQGGFEQAQAQAGLGWGGQQAAQQGNLLQMLQGLV